ncbi:hypothetical protein [Sporomusa acidovorans]|uniref:DUF2283 domain-containing protein n=1 Tax=Sporomusa acidovorans (strain ATCC 49682 / DSM 3132 / Mol) TaxID=1123286 RepID=A0ABZ3J1W5_SPOA4|nr:hypothetical protein [Sporomusa acidovorans]OZC13659.1 hypothetical protein SPACI_56400 [Sporomusa acidovorans DSM 3132]SDE85898.1 hypothetical protein SAMN04488499_102412 [Sporomusa acidovorans]
MRITFEKQKNGALIYIYFRDFDGIIVSTLTNVTGNLLLDANNRWIGVEVGNTVHGGTIRLPRMKQPYFVQEKESFSQDEGIITAIFDTNIQVAKREAIECNVDFNDVNGLQGIEIIADTFDAAMDVANRL